MKRNLTTTGSIELEPEDLVTAARDYLMANEDKLILFLKDYLKRTENVLVKKVERSGDRVVAIVEGYFDEGARRFSSESKTRGTKKALGGHRKPFVGFYDHTLDIIEAQRKRKKTFISWEDLREELLSIADGKGKPKFEMDGEPIEMSRIKQYLAPSQIKRQKNLRGVKVDKLKGGLHI